MYDEQLKVTKYSFENKLIELLKELKEFKFQQNLRINKKDEALKTKYSQTHRLIQKIDFNDKNIDELLDIPHNQLLSGPKRWTYEGSCRTINSIIKHELVFLFQKLLLTKVAPFFIT